MSIKCAACGGEELASGSVQANGRLYFRPDNVSFVKLRTADVKVSAHICTQCGFVTLIGDAKKAKALLDKGSA